MGWFLTNAYSTATGVDRNGFFYGSIAFSHQTSITVPAHESPTPKAANSILSPLFALPCFRASARAMGMVDDTVLPQLRI